MSSSLSKKNNNSLKWAFLIVFFMLGLSFASVPLYDLFCRVTGYAGTVYANSNFGVNVFIDGVQIYSTGIHGTGTAQPLSVVGELVKPTSNRAGYLNHANLKFNESFRVQRMSTATATSVNVAYKIVGEG